MSVRRKIGFLCAGLVVAVVIIIATCFIVTTQAQAASSGVKSMRTDAAECNGSGSGDCITGC